MIVHPELFAGTDALPSATRDFYSRVAGERVRFESARLASQLGERGRGGPRTLHLGPRPRPSASTTLRAELVARVEAGTVGCDDVFAWNRPRFFQPIRFVEKCDDPPVDPGAFRDGLFALHTRRFGAVSELMIKRLAGLGPAKTIYHDLHDELAQQRVEVKFSRVLTSHDAPVTLETLLDAVAAQRLSARMVSYEERKTAAFDCNIQQIKPAEFDVMYYGLFFSDQVLIFRMEPDQLGSSVGYSGKQHKGNIGEGQFHIKPSNIAYHEQHFLYRALPYGELVVLLTAAAPDS